MPAEALSLLGDISTEDFLTHYWQRKPLLIRNAIPNFKSLVSADELAGLALEDFVESRLVQYKLKQNQWQLRHGPFSESTFAKLPKTHWTLLVQGVDTLVPAVAEFLHQFRFVPNWRLDDVMVSYAADQGSVGPHFDHYDVFLVQAKGKREWRVGDRCGPTSKLLDNCDLAILDDFHANETWLLEPGDILYLPPLVSHWGIAQGNCMTYSVGFRAPKLSELLCEYSEELVQHPKLARHLCDDLQSSNAASQPGEITPAVLEKVRSELLAAVDDPTLLARWFGQYVTKTRYPDIAARQIKTKSSRNKGLRHAPGSRFAYIAEGDSGLLFVNGELYPASLQLAATLANKHHLSTDDLKQLSAQDQSIIQILQQQGLLI